MSELAVAILAIDDEQRTLLQMLVDGTTIARTVHSFNGFPVATTDSVLRRIQDLHPDVVVVDIPARDASSALRAIEVLHADYNQGVIFAVGEMSQPQTIVAAMRAGAREFIERPTTSTSLLEAFVRLTSARRKQHKDGQRGKVFTIVNAKGGSGATTVAVNTALALQASLGNTALVDLAPLGHTALHLNVKPTFTVVDAIRNLHRLDSSLLDSFMVRHSGGLQLLAGAPTPFNADPATGEMARLFDLLASNYKSVVVDASSRLDAVTRVVSDLSDMVLIVAHTDVTSLWSAARVCQFLGETANASRIRLVLNRFRKISGFTEADAESAAGAKLFWKLPNQYPSVSAGIDRGVPVVTQNHSDVARSFSELADALNEAEETKPRSWSLFKTTA
jgi:pilus assembly protein CpaE